jgi:hypothetical protein
MKHRPLTAEKIGPRALEPLAAAQLDIAQRVDLMIAGGGYLGVSERLINFPVADRWRFELDASYGVDLSYG